MSVELRESVVLENAQSRIDNNKFIVSGQFSKADLRNENGRVYKRSMWESVLHRPQIVDALKKRKMLGELGHPDKIETTLKEVSHIVTALELKDDGEIWGEAEILNTPNGQILKTLYEAGVQLGISSRGYLPEGSNLYAEGEDLIVPDDYELITFDFVIDPSSQGAEPTVNESVKEKLTTILTESRSKISSDIADYIEKLNVTPVTEATENKENTVLTEADCKTNNKVDDFNNSGISKEDQTSMENNEAYVNRLEGVVGELRDRYLTAESVIKEFVDERKKADDMLKGVTDRYLTAEQAIEGLRDYSLKLEETVDQVVKLYKTSEAVIGTLRDRCKCSESVIKDLRDRYTLSESVIVELANSYRFAEQVIAALRDRYTLSEEVIKEFAVRYSIAEQVVSEMARRNELSEQVIVGLKDRLEAARKSNVALKKKLSEQTGAVEIDANTDAKAVDELQATVNEQKEEIEKLTNELTEAKAVKQAEPVEEKKQPIPVPASYFEDCSVKYGISVTECKKAFQALGCRKSAFEYHMNTIKRMSRNNYSEFSYMVHNGTASNALTEGKENEVDKIARLVEGAF